MIGTRIIIIIIVNDYYICYILLYFKSLQAPLVVPYTCC